MNNKHYIGRAVHSLEHYDKVGPITGVSILVDEDNEYVAGDMTGYVFETTCPYGTQAMANAMLASLQGKVYKGFRATDAILDKDAELGDGITIDGEYAMLAYQEITFGPKHTSEIAAPGESILEHEYPYVGSTQKTINRKIAQVNSKITKTSEEIMLKVSKELDGLSASIDVKLESITSTVQGLDGRVATVEQTATGLTSTVQGLNGQVSTLQQTATSLTSSIQGINGEISTIEQTLQGVAFKSSLADGTTTINGGCITTGKILASYIKLGGYMDLYESLSSSTVSGRFGKTTVTVNSSSYNALGFTSLSNVYIGGPQKGFIVTGANLEAYAGGNIILQAPKNNGVLTYGNVLAFNDAAIAYSSSDRRLKTDIDYDVTEKLISAFDGLKPVFFRLKNDMKERQNHIGFVAQDVVESIEAAGLGNALTTVDCNGNYALNYGEMVALLTAKIKQLEKRLEGLST